MALNAEVSNALRQYPEVEVAVGPRVIEQLDTHAGQLFCSDAEYFEAVRVLVATRRKTLVGERGWPLGELAVGEPSSRQKSIVDALGRIHAQLEDLTERRLLATRALGRLPRIIRLAERLGLSPKERRALEYMLIHAVGNDLSVLDDEIKDAALFAGMEPAEAYEFLRPDRLHMREGLFEVENAPGASHFRRDFRVSPELLKALAGGQLSDEESLKIDGTTLAAVLAEEPAFQRMAQGPPGAVPTAEAPSSDGAGPSDGECAPATGKPVASDESRQSERVEKPASILRAYATDLEYLEDLFDHLATVVKHKKLIYDEQRWGASNEPGKATALRELGGRERMLRKRCERRLALTRQAGSWLPRLERLVAARGLDPFERNVLITLVGLRISVEVQKVVERSYSAEVNDMLTVWCSTVEERIRCRRYFYRSGTLVREGLLRVEDNFGRDLGAANVEIDRRILDHILGLDTEASELVEGSRLFTPKVSTDQVVLPADQKKLVVDTVTHFEAFRRARRDLGFDEIISYGRGIVMLFHGPSGTGKTMLAGALAHHLGKKILLINFPSLGGACSGEVAKFIFREARLQDAVVFFDECEAVFQTRDKGPSDVNVLLTELERHDGLVIMATNRPFELDEAMHRRITLALELRPPTADLREAIWRNHIPPAALSPEADLRGLAARYELTGGFIKNAVVYALSAAVARNEEAPLITHADLDQGARLQLRERLRLTELDRRVVPSQGLDALVLPELLMTQLREIVEFEKARKVLFGQWGFGERQGYGRGTVALFQGSPGTGKSLAAEAIAFEIGQPLKVVNTAEVLSRYVGDTPKNIDALFREAQAAEAVLVFDDAEGLFGARTSAGSATERYANVDVSTLLHHLERHPGLVILTTNLGEHLDEALTRRFRYMLEFPLPNAELRCALWRKLVPAGAPIAADVDFGALASSHRLAGGSVWNAIFRAAARAALRPVAEQVIRMQDLVEAAREEAARHRTKTIGLAS
jgi:SpoVK/Ycf46/Vps4 family AAA+-type ATPase